MDAPGPAEHQTNAIQSNPNWQKGRHTFLAPASSCGKHAIKYVCASPRREIPAHVTCAGPVAQAKSKAGLLRLAQGIRKGSGRHNRVGEQHNKGEVGIGQVLWEGEGARNQPLGQILKSRLGSPDLVTTILVMQLWIAPSAPLDSTQRRGIFSEPSLDMGQACQPANSCPGLGLHPYWHNSTNLLVERPKWGGNEGTMWEGCRRDMGRMGWSWHMPVPNPPSVPKARETLFQPQSWHK